VQRLAQEQLVVAHAVVAGVEQGDPGGLHLKGFKIPVPFMPRRDGIRG
jgi:hypothetical protein